MTMDMLEDFLSEATLMIDFRHDNVLSLIGVVWEQSERPLVVLPFMENGDLRKVVRDQSTVSQAGSDTSVHPVLVLMYR